ncbi:hypothetical protein Barb6_01004 [Bacteroidales bacterium Barb6]|nr:hypothetical protein Barb6_01004 [Bacteroidales bacterium Barb6]
MRPEEMPFFALIKAATPTHLYYGDGGEIYRVYKENGMLEYSDTLNFENIANDELDKLYTYLIDYRDFASVRRILDGLMCAYQNIADDVYYVEYVAFKGSLLCTLASSIHDTISASFDVGITFPESYIKNCRMNGISDDAGLALMEFYNEENANTLNGADTANDAPELPQHNSDSTLGDAQGNIDDITTREDIINELIPSLINRSYTTELRKSLQGLRVGKTIEIKGTVTGVIEKLKPYFDSEFIPHKQYNSIYELIMGDFTKKGVGIQKSTVNSALRAIKERKLKSIKQYK